jgi:hypothetical protein
VNERLPREIVDTVEHIETLERAIEGLKAEVRHLAAARIATVERLADQCAELVDEREWSATRLLQLYKSLKRHWFCTAWLRAGLPHPQRLRADAERNARRQRRKGGA